ncbi:MAG: flagellar basal body P-ring formation protein FlgA [Nitrospira sp.]|nr:MAG: flagellar basal body P-ring formation protein FlgA [Nitrospira sp.]
MRGGVFPMIVSRLFIQSALVAVIGLEPLVADAVSLLPIQSVAVGESRPAHRVDEKHSESRQAIHQLHPEQIERSILRVLEQEMAGKVRAVHAVVIDPLDPMKVPSGDMSLRILPSGVEGGLGRRVFHIQVDMNGKSWQTIDAIADVSASIDAVVPTRAIQIDSVIDAEDITTHRVKLTDLDHQLMTDVKDVIGKSAVRPLQTNNPIRLGMLKRPNAVRKGDRVSIEARHGGLSIQVTGLAKSSGEIGQTATVINVDSGKELRAKIVGPGAVRVEFSPRLFARCGLAGQPF